VLHPVRHLPSALGQSENHPSLLRKVNYNIQKKDNSKADLRLQTLQTRRLLQGRQDEAENHLSWVLRLVALILRVWMLRQMKTWCRDYASSMSCSGLFGLVDKPTY
jgi:hypothetical protein